MAMGRECAGMREKEGKGGKGGKGGNGRDGGGRSTIRQSPSTIHLLPHSLIEASGKAYAFFTNSLLRPIAPKPSTLQSML